MRRQARLLRHDGGCKQRAAARSWRGGEDVECQRCSQIELVVQQPQHTISCFCTSCPLRRPHAGVGSGKSAYELSTRGIATNMARPGCALPRPLTWNTPHHHANMDSEKLVVHRKLPPGGGTTFATEHDTAHPHISRGYLLQSIYFIYVHSLHFRQSV